MACDGDIASQEIQYVKNFANELNIGKSLIVEETLNKYVAEINKLKQFFLNNFIKELAEQHLDEDQELQLVKLSVNMILADDIIEYSEIKFFKRIRSKLKISDEQIREILPEDSDNPNMPTKNDFLDTDIHTIDNFLLDMISFKEITFDFQH